MAPHPTHRPDGLSSKNECGRGDVSQPKGPKATNVKPRAGASFKFDRAPLPLGTIDKPAVAFLPATAGAPTSIGAGAGKIADWGLARIEGGQPVPRFGSVARSPLTGRGSDGRPVQFLGLEHPAGGLARSSLRARVVGLCSAVPVPSHGANERLGQFLDTCAVPAAAAFARLQVLAEFVLGLGAGNMGDSRTIADMTGQRFGRLTVLSLAPREEGCRKVRWVCRCDCGTVFATKSYRLKNGETASCGCSRLGNKNQTGASVTTHGASRRGPDNSTYRSWKSMNDRCRYPSLDMYRHYGGRGIKVCDRWKSFENFLADMGRRPAEMTLDRIDVNGDYEPGNCRWADDATQRRNTRRSRLITCDGEEKTLAEWARDLGMHRSLLHQRLKRFPTDSIGVSALRGGGTK